MEMIGISAVLALVLMLSSEQKYQGGPVASEYIAIGAFVGSLIATCFRRSVRWLFQLFTGFWVGFVSARWLIDYMEWPLTVDYALMSGSIMGAIGFKLVEIMLDSRMWKVLKEKILAWLPVPAGNK